MKKLIKITLLLTLVFFTQSIFAATQDWNFDNQANHTLSNNTLLEIDNGVSKLSNINFFAANWRMDENIWNGTVGEVIDSSQNTNNGVSHGAEIVNSGILENAGHFIRTEKDYLDFGTINNPGISDFSFGGWFKTIETSNNGMVISRSVYSAADGRYSITVKSNGHVRTFIDIGNEPYVESSTSYNDGNWHLTIAKVDRDGYLELYVDNVFIGRTDISARSAFDYTGYNRNFYIGTYNDNTGLHPHSSYGYFNGDIDEAFFLRRIITAQEMDTLWGAGNGGRILQYSDTKPYIQPQSSLSFARRINHFYETTSVQNEGNIIYQLSSDNGINWKYWDGNAWVTTTQTNGTETNNASDIDAHIIELDNDGGNFLWRAFLVSDGQEKVELDKLNIIYDVNNAPDITSNGGLASASIHVDENQTNVTTVTATDPDTGDTVTYAILDGSDHTLFSLDANTGVLTLNAALDFENPTDANTDGIYEVRVRASDGYLQDVQSISLTIDDINETPSITTPFSLNINENNTLVSTITSLDLDAGVNGTLNYSVTGGDDQALFHVDAVSGELSFLSAPDFENPNSLAGTNDYEIEITVNDGGGLSQLKTFIVTILDVNEKKKKSSRRMSKQKLAQIFGTKIEKPKEESKQETQQENKENTCHITYTRLIKKRMKGEDVRQVQHCMNQLGYTTGPEDGIYGPLTYAGVTSYQRAMNLHYIDGIVGPETVGVLNG